MPVRRLIFVVPFALGGCGLLAQLEPPPEPPCERMAFYPDADGNGLGEPTSVYVGCAAPEGYVTELDPALVDTDPPDTDVVDTDDSDVPDTDDSDVPDTDVPDTDGDSDDSDVPDTDADTDL